MQVSVNHYILKPWKKSWPNKGDYTAYLFHHTIHLCSNKELVLSSRVKMCPILFSVPPPQ